MNDPQLWWFVSRVSAMVAWAIMSFSIVWGVLLASRVFRGLDNPAWLKDLHKYLSTLTVLFAALHMGALMLDHYVAFDLADLFIPGVAAYEGSTDVQETAIAIGVVAFWALAVVYLTSLVMDKLPRRVWKGLHFLSYGVFFAIAWHAAFAGSDVGSWWYGAVSIFVITMSIIAMVLRFAAIAMVARKAEKDAEVAAMRAAAGARGAEQSITNGAATALVPSDPDSREPRSMVVESITHPARDIARIRLVPVGGGRVAWWDAGSHITLHLPTGLERQYSLCGDPADHGAYEIAVLNTRGPEGGSTWIHDHVHPGMIMTVSGPRNHFPLVPAHRYLFIAGGIGITPIRAMIESLPAHRVWSLVYLGKSRETMAFASELEATFGDKVRVHESSVDGRFDLAEALAAEPGEVYCCGTEELMSEVESRVGAPRAHIERFNPVVRELSGGAQPVRVTCARSHKVIEVAAAESILSGLTKAGVDVDASCKKGVCGSCETRVISGTPAHLDSVLPDATKNEMGVFYPCVSRATTKELVIDA